MQVLARLGKWDQAIDQARGLMRTSKDPEDKANLAQLLLNRARRTPSFQNDLAEADRLLEELNSDKWEPATVMLLQAETLAVRGKWEEARQKAEKARDQSPGQIPAWLMLISLAEKNKDVLAAAADRRGGTPDRTACGMAAVPRRALAAGHARNRKKMPEPLSLLDHVDDQNRDRLLSTLANVYIAVGDLATARKLAAELCARRPNELSVWQTQFDLFIEMKDWQQARSIIPEIQRLDSSEGTYALCAEAEIRLALAKAGDQKMLTEAHDYIARAAVQRPAWIKVLLLQASLFDREGNAAAALEKYRLAIDHGESRLGVVRRTLELMYSQKMFAEAGEMLRKLPERML